jgi:hypothetical protein
VILSQKTFLKLESLFNLSLLFFKKEAKKREQKE